MSRTTIPGCSTCLSLNRRMTALVDKQLIFKLCPLFFINVKYQEKLMVCWECNLMIFKIKQFTNKLRNTQCGLLTDNRPSADGFSTLQMTGIETIQILPDKQEIEELVTVNETNDEKRSFSSITSPATEADRRDVVCDFDELIQPTAIPLCPIIKRKSQIVISPKPIFNCETPVEVMTIEQNSQQNQNITQIINAHTKIKTEDPIENSEIFYRSQEPFTYIPESIVPRGYKEVVKVTVGKPNEVTECQTDRILSDIGIEEVLPDVTSSDMDLLPILLDNANNSRLNRKQNIDSDNKFTNGHSGAIIRLLTGQEVLLFREKLISRCGYYYSDFRCQGCIMHFSNMPELVEHNLKHDVKSGNYECNICKQRFSTDMLRDDHYINHFIIFQCLKCPFRSDDSKKMSAHISQLHEVTQFICKKCNETFKTLRDKLFHVRSFHIQHSIDSTEKTSTDKTSTEYDWCIETGTKVVNITKEQGNTTRHVNIQRPQSMIFKDSKSTPESFSDTPKKKINGEQGVVRIRRINVKKTHNTISKDPKSTSETFSKNQKKIVPKKRRVFLKCEVCFKSVNRRAYKYHMAKNHRPQQSNLDGNIVPKHTGPHTPLLVTKRKYKTKEKLAVKCHHCEEFFTNKNDLKTHINSLTRNFSCATCFKTFTSKRDIRKHVIWGHGTESGPEIKTEIEDSCLE